MPFSWAFRLGIVRNRGGVRQARSWISGCFTQNRARGGSGSVNQNRNEHQRRCDEHREHDGLKPLAPATLEVGRDRVRLLRHLRHKLERIGCERPGHRSRFASEETRPYLISRKYCAAPELAVVKGLVTIGPGTSSHGPAGELACCKVNPPRLQLTVSVVLDC